MHTRGSESDGAKFRERRSVHRHQMFDALLERPSRAPSEVGSKVQRRVVESRSMKLQMATVTVDADGKKAADSLGDEPDVCVSANADTTRRPADRPTD